MAELALFGNSASDENCDPNHKAILGDFAVLGCVCPWVVLECRHQRKRERWLVKVKNVYENISNYCEDMVLDFLNGWGDFLASWVK